MLRITSIRPKLLKPHPPNVHTRTPILIPMNKLFWLPLAAAALAAAPAAAQRSLVPGEVTRGTLSSGDPRDEDDRYYDEYSFEARRGETVIVRMESDAFDTYLYLGTASRRYGWRELARDDDGGDGTDSRIRWVIPEDGIYVVRASSLHEAQGRYEITLQGGRATSDGGYYEPDPVRPRPGRPGRPARDGYVQAGERVDGYLSRTDPTLDNGAPFHIYRYSGRAGERLTISLYSDDFDAYLVLGTPGGRHGVNNALARDDDGGGGRNSRIDFTLPNDGEYVVRVNPLAAGEGNYTLDVSSSLGGAPVEDYDDGYQDDYDDGAVESRLIGRWGLTAPGARVRENDWSSISASASMGILTIDETGAYTWRKNGRMLRGQLVQITPRREARPGTRYYSLNDGRDEYYVFWTEYRGQRYMQLNRRATDVAAAYGYRDPNSR